MSMFSSQLGGLQQSEPTCVLVVDDDPSQRMLCGAHLRRDGYQVVEAENGSDALRLIARTQPDIIIMDVKMPVMDGLMCTKALKSSPATAHIPIIMASAATSGDNIVAGLESGADEYVTKPLNSKTFRLRVRSMVRLAKANKALIQTTDALGEQNRNLGIILELSFDLNTIQDEQTIVRKVLSAAGEIVGSRKVSLWLADWSKNHLRLAGASDLMTRAGQRASVPFGEGVTGRAFRSDNPLLYNAPENLRDDMHPCEEALLSEFPVLAVPLTASGEALGVLTLGDRVAGRPFTPREIAYVDMVVNLAASSLHDLDTRRTRDDAHESIVVALAKLAEHRDDDTGKHLDRVTEFSVTLAMELRRQDRFREAVTDEFIRSLRLAVPLHDIGKVAVPDKILLKPGRLTQHEIEIMRTHVRFGTETIRSVRDRAPNSRFLALAEEVCSAHHEWYDGCGYPDGISGDEIPLSARIAAIADVYDALTSKRVYKPAMPHDKAFGIIVSSSGTQFDPDVVQAFIDREQDFIRLAQELADDDVDDDTCARDTVALDPAAAPVWSESEFPPATS